MSKKRKKLRPMKVYPTFEQAVVRDWRGDHNVVLIKFDDAPALKNGESIEIVWDPLITIVSD